MGKLGKNAFACVAVPSYPEKPRENTLTMVLEYGLGIPQQKGLMETAGFYWDLAKLATGVSRILPEEILRRKLALYRENQIHSFPGGQFFEVAHLQGRAEAYFEEVRRVGFSHVEISENCIDLPAGKKAEYIRRAGEIGLTVLGEAGKKGEGGGGDELIADLLNCKEAGAWKVFVEAMELIEGQELNLPVIEKILGKVEAPFLIFEIPGLWVKGITFDVQYGFWKTLIRHIGPEVNLANIPAEELLRLSLMRLGLGADTTLEKGAFVLSKRGLLP